MSTWKEWRIERPTGKNRWIWIHVEGFDPRPIRYTLDTARDWIDGEPPRWAECPLPVNEEDAPEDPSRLLDDARVFRQDDGTLMLSLTFSYPSGTDTLEAPLVGLLQDWIRLIRQRGENA